MQVQDVVVANSNGGKKSLSMTILGDPPAQNGWKAKLNGSGRIIMYDEKSTEKRRLRFALMKELQQLTESVPLFSSTKLKMNVLYQLGGVVTRKDIDNMTKYLLDALEAALYDNDKWIVELNTKKISAGTPATVLSIEPSDL